MDEGLEALKEYRSQQQGVNVHADVYLDIIEKELKDYKTFKTGLILGNMSVVDNKILKEYQEIIEIAKRYNWDDITSEIFNVKTDKKYRDLFDSAIVNIQEDYRKARALEIIKDFVWIENDEIHLGLYGDSEIVLRENDFESKEKYDLLKEVLL